MRTVNEELHRKKKIDLMERCFECYAEFGLNNIGIKGLSKVCGVSPANLYGYFNDLDDLIIQATEYCMSKVEDGFYLQEQLRFLKQSIALFYEKFRSQA